MLYLYDHSNFVNNLSFLEFNPGALPKRTFRRLKKNKLFRGFLKLTEASVDFYTTSRRDISVSLITFPVNAAICADGFLFPDMLKHSVLILNRYAIRPLTGLIHQSATRAPRSYVYYHIHADGSIDMDGWGAYGSPVPIHDRISGAGGG